MGVADVTPVDSIRSEMMALREEERLVSPGDDGSPGAGFFQQSSWRRMCSSEKEEIFNNSVEEIVEPHITL